MITSTSTFTCCVCRKDKSDYWKFHAAHGQVMCLWCAEDNGLVKPNRPYSPRRMRRY
jgi:hypothetical protein